MTGKGSNNCSVASHQSLKNLAKNRVDNLQLIVNKLQLARKENRAGDVAKLEEQVNEVLSEWNAELDGASPASSSLEESLGSFAEQLGSLLGQFDVEDDATSPLAKPPFMSHGNEHEETLGMIHRLVMADSAGDKEVYYMNHTPQQHDIQSFENHGTNYVPQLQDFQGFQDHIASHLPQQQEFQGFQNHTPQQPAFQGFEHHNCTHMLQGTMVNNFEASYLNNLTGDNLHMGRHLDYLNSNVPQDFENELFLGANGIESWDLDVISDTGVFTNVNPPPSASLRPGCALWDCTRDAQGMEPCKDYCSSFHAVLAVKECPSGTAPILRPGGIGLKDGPLILALRSKVEGKDVGIPECPGAAKAKSPWNAPELFDISMLEGERIREWLFFDIPRRAFETGNRKQRSLPDYAGRGWHESRKQMINEYGGRKRSYYADPQPQEHFEWHLYEYEVDNCDAFALYRLELKVAEEKKKKSPKTKTANDPLIDLQKRMGRLTAVVSTEDKSAANGKAKGKEQSDIQSVQLPASSANEVNVLVPGGQPKKHFTDDRNSW